MKNNFKYTLIFSGRNSHNIRIDAITGDYLEELRNTPDEDLYQKAYEDNFGDELRIYGIDAWAGFIEVFETNGSKTLSYEDLGKPFITIQGDDSGIVSIETNEPMPEPNSLIIGCVSIEDGIMGHIDLELADRFDPKNLSVIFTSGQKYVTDSAITGIQYKNGKEVIKESINSSEYLNSTPKGEIFYCSRFDEESNEIPLFENGEWVN